MTDNMAALVDAAVTDLLGDAPARTVTEVRARSVLAQLAQRVSTQAEDGYLRSLRTAAEVSEDIGLDTRQVLRLAQRLGVGWATSRGPSGKPREILFRPTDIEALRNRPDGRRRA